MSKKTMDTQNIQEHQEHNEYDTEQYYQGTGSEEYGYKEESNEQEHIQVGVTGESEDEYQDE